MAIAVCHYTFDKPLIHGAYKEQYGYTLYADTSYKLHYWTRVTAHCTAGGHALCMGLEPGGFVRRSIDSDGSTIPTESSTGLLHAGIFYPIDRISTALMGSQR